MQPHAILIVLDPTLVFLGMATKADADKSTKQVIVSSSPSYLVLTVIGLQPKPQTYS